MPKPKLRATPISSAQAGRQGLGSRGLAFASKGLLADVAFGASTSQGSLCATMPLATMRRAQSRQSLEFVDGRAPG